MSSTLFIEVGDIIYLNKDKSKYVQMVLKMKVQNDEVWHAKQMWGH